jgi:hypothetical protein
LLSINNCGASNPEAIWSLPISAGRCFFAPSGLTAAPDDVTRAERVHLHEADPLNID